MSPLHEIVLTTAASAPLSPRLAPPAVSGVPKVGAGPDELVARARDILAEETQWWQSRQASTTSLPHTWSETDPDA